MRAQLNSFPILVALMAGLMLGACKNDNESQNTTESAPVRVANTTAAASASPPVQPAATLPVSVVPPAPPITAIDDFFAANKRIPAGTTTTLTPLFHGGIASIYSDLGGESDEVDGGAAALVAAEITSGEQITVRPKKNTTYTLSVSTSGTSETRKLTIVTTSDLATPRFGHDATLLPNGKVLVVGGMDGIHVSAASAELYDPATFSFSDTGSLNAALGGPTAILLPNGNVLVMGWSSLGTTVSAELYDQASGTFSVNGSLNTTAGSSVTLLPNGKVLLAGGRDANEEECDPKTHLCHFVNRLANTVLYDPATAKFATTGSLVTARDGHTATVLQNGKVLMVGGLGKLDSAEGGNLASVELYDPATGKFAATGSLVAARFAHSATLLQNGRVLIAGGRGNAVASKEGVSKFFSNDEVLDSAELYDPVTGKFAAIGNLSATRTEHTATLLQNGKVLLVGGSGEVISYFTETDLAGSKKTHTYERRSSETLASADLYDPSTGKFTATGSLATERRGHSATLLPNGQVLIVGGGDEKFPLVTAEIYDPGTGLFSSTVAQAAKRNFHNTTLPLSGVAPN